VPPQWSPPVIGGMTFEHRTLPAADVVAAMEPADWREHPDLATFIYNEPVPPQWSPPVIGGSAPGLVHRNVSPVAPQWSPSFTDGSIDRTARHSGDLVQAAMEPVAGRRENPNMSTLQRWTEQPQWSRRLSVGARSSGSCGTACRSERNGARRLSAGAPRGAQAHRLHRDPTAMEPAFYGALQGVSG
jgi:hypothetical protein